MRLLLALSLSVIAAISAAARIHFFDDVNSTNIKDVFRANGHVITEGGDPRQYAGDPLPPGTQVVFLRHDSGLAGDMPQAGQQQLVSFVQQGGLLVLSGCAVVRFTQYTHMSALWPASAAQFYGGDLTIVRGVQDSILNAGLPNSFNIADTGSAFDNVVAYTIRNSATTYYNLTDDGVSRGPSVIGLNFGRGRVIALPFYSDYGTALAGATGNLVRTLMNNTILWGTRPVRSWVLLQNTSSGALSTWNLNTNFQATGVTALGVSAPANIPFGTTDLNNDGILDLVVRSTSNIAFMFLVNSLTPFAPYVACSPRLLNSRTSATPFIGFGDFDRDGFDDAVYHVPGSQRLEVDWGRGFGTDGTVAITTATQMPPIAVSDFSLDGNPDILFFHTNTRNFFYWRMIGTTFNASVVINPPLAPGEEFAGTGDINADGLTDIVIFNPTTRAVTVWVMGTTAPSRYVSLGTAPVGTAPRGAGHWQ